MKVTLRTLGGEEVCEILNASDRTLQELIDLVNTRRKYKLNSMRLIISSSEEEKEIDLDDVRNIYFRDIFSDQHQSNIVLTIYSHPRHIYYAKDMKRIIENIGQIFHPDIGSQTNFDNSEQFDIVLTKARRVLLYRPEDRSEEVEYVINLIKKFIITENVIRSMIRELIKQAFKSPYIMEIIYKLREYQFPINLDPNDQDNLSADQPITEFRKRVVNEVQDGFNSLLDSINEYPCKMLSYVIIISKLYKSRFVPKVILAMVSSKLLERKNPGNVHFILSYFNVLLEICTNQLDETVDGQLLKVEIVQEKKEMERDIEGKKQGMERDIEEKKRKEEFYFFKHFLMIFVVLIFSFIIIFMFG